MKPTKELTRRDGSIQRLYRVGKNGFSFVKAPGDDLWAAAPLVFRDGSLESLAIPVNSPFGRPRKVREDEIDAIVSNFLERTPDGSVE